MQSILRLVRGPRPLSSPWSDIAPVREELFGIERLEQHAESLAAAQSVTARPPHVLSLHARLRDNAAVLLAAYRASAAELESGRGEVPAAEWLLDNYHLVEEHIREIKDDLPTGYYRQLPKLADGPFAGYPRVFGLAWGFVAHTDSHFDPDSFRRFVAAYQRVQPLTIGELWGGGHHLAHRLGGKSASAGRPDECGTAGASGGGSPGRSIVGNRLCPLGPG
uniref:Carbohydrate binding:Glycosyltransferase 36:Glycosyltransferase 36 associated n=1 Tax=Magnetospirillum gryphiswaldense TaxID=55518 RepID=A4U2C2_9PROT|nr:carbohydrate binding:Glycosyltransferase 36:Glycosyltransferase 36 associated [Magnetospirillum gryphiswaldense MSR-1]